MSIVSGINSEIRGQEDEENPKSKSYEKDSVTTSQQDPGLCVCQKRWRSENIKLPSLHHPEENRKEYLEKGVPLYNDILNGDLIGMKLILRNAPTLLYSSIAEGYETALHVAVGAKQDAMVKELVVQMESKDLELQDSTGNTAFCIATAGDGVEIAKILMEKNSQLPFLRGACNKTPLNIAAVYGNRKMIRLLYKKFEDHIHHLNNVELEEIFFACINAHLFGLAIKMLEDGQSLAWARNKDEEIALEILARMPSAFGCESTSRIQEVPDERDRDKDKDFICYNMLHLAAKLPSLDSLDTESDPVRQMQVELLWFKAVEKLMQPSEREKRDPIHHLTPRELFTKEHGELRKAGEEWIKNIGQSGMIVATLVIAIAFTITSSLPGGNDSKTGIPTDINRNMFQVFMLAAAVAMFSSITSTHAGLLMSTMRFNDESFLHLIPGLLNIGVMMLFLSFVGMMVAFAGILFLAYSGKHDMWIPLLAIGISVFPMFYVLQYPFAVVIRWYYPLSPSPSLFEPSKTKFWEVQPSK